MTAVEDKTARLDQMQSLSKMKGHCWEKPGPHTPIQRSGQRFGMALHCYGYVSPSTNHPGPSIFILTRPPVVSAHPTLTDTHHDMPGLQQSLSALFAVLKMLRCLSDLAKERIALFRWITYTSSL